MSECSTASRKLWNILLLAELLLSGCGPAESPKPPAQPANVSSIRATPSPETKTAIDWTKEIKATKRWRIAFFPKDNKFASMLGTEGMSFWELVWNNFQEAAQDFGLEVSVVYKQEDCPTDAECVEPQIRLIHDVLKQGSADGIIVCPFDSNRLVPVIEQAVSAGIPVIGFDTPINSEQVTFLRFDNFSAARSVGEWVVKQLKGRGKVLIVEGEPLVQQAIDRRNGFLAGLATGSMEVLDTKPGRWQDKMTRQIVNRWLKEFDTIDVIMAASDGMAIAAAEVIAGAGRKKNIMVTGFDGQPRAVEAIRRGLLDATANQAVDVQARYALQLMVRRLELREKFPPVVDMPEVPLITRDNIGDYLKK